MLTKFKEIYDLALYKLKEVTFDKDHAWHRALVALYCSIVEYSETTIFLIDNNRIVGVPHIIRSLLEAHVDLLNLASDQKYGYFMEANYKYEWLKLLKEAQKRKNPTLVDLYLNPSIDIDKEVKKVESMLQEYKDNGARPLNQFQKFEKAGLEGSYRSIYNLLCSESHNNLRALIHRHISINEKTNRFEVVIFENWTLSSYESYIMHGLTLLSDSSYIFHSALESGLEIHFDSEKFLKEYFSLRSDKK